MTTFIVLLFTVLIGFAREKDKLNSKPLKSNALKITELKTIAPDEGFYDRIYASLSSNGKLVVADIGNRTINIYDENYKRIKQFGKEGSGPGEFENIFGVSTSNDRIYVRSHFNRISIFDFKGNHIKDVNSFEFGSGEMVFNDGIIMKYKDDAKYLMVVYDKNGEVTKQIENKNYKEPETRGNRMMLTISGSSYVPYKNGYVKAERGEYLFKFFDKSFNETESYTKDFERVKRDLSGFNFSLKMEGASKKQQAEAQQRMKEQAMKQLGEYEDDVNSALGFVGDYLLLSVATSAENKLLIDVISPDKQYFTQVELEGDEIINSSVQQNKLLIAYKNEEQGPYLKVYDLSIQN
ncbi:MAG: hypothetical protein KDD94_14270 [Calditrichaeota bacterium]|nr:hypothetical protein [Calditrichota bacterium]